MTNAQPATFYDTDFYQDQQSGSLRSARVVVPLILSLCEASSIVDVGCGVGTWLSVAREHGVEDVLGLDGDYVDRAMLKIPSSQFAARDLAEPLAVGRTFDLALCLEVGEHMTPAAGDRLVAELVALAPVVVFSAALPGQWGTNHINGQWQDYWRKRFASHGFDAYDLIRPRLWSNEDVDYWYRQNIICYAKPGAPQFAALPKVQDDQSLNVVHPALYSLKCQQAEMYLSKALTIFPSLVKTAVKNRFRGQS